MEPKTGKRIVSRISLFGMHIGLNTLTNGLEVMAPAFAVAGAVCIILTFSAAGMAINGGAQSLLRFVGLLLTTGTLAAFTYITDEGAKASRKKVVALKSFMVAQAADLPAPDSLVRASSEPRQTQEGVLLRAAAEGMERHEEQLVRAFARE